MSKSNNRYPRVFDSQVTVINTPSTSGSNTFVTRSDQTDTIAYTLPTTIGDGFLRNTNQGGLSWDTTLEGRIDALESALVNEDIICRTFEQTRLFVTTLLANPGGLTSVSLYPRSDPFGSPITYDTSSSVLTADGIWTGLIPSDNVSETEDIAIVDLEIIECNDLDITGLVIPGVNLDNIKDDCHLQKYTGMLSSYQATIASGNPFEIKTVNNPEFVNYTTAQLSSTSPELYVMATRGTTTAYVPIVTTSNINYTA